METDVLIVGAGPCGLTLANILARYGIDFHIVSKESGPTKQSRAGLVHIRTLELWDKLDLATQALQQGVPLRGVNVMTRGKPVAYFPFAGDAPGATPFPSPLSLPQSHTEQLLLQSLSAHGKEVTWENGFLTLTQTDDAVHAIVRDADGTKQRIVARWLVGCDGGKSTVRHALDINFPGSTYEQSAFLADVTLDPPYEPDKLHLNLSNYGFVGIEPFSAEQFRLFGALSPAYAAGFGAQNEGQSVRREDIQQWFWEYFYLLNTITQVDWSAIYRVHCRLAEHFRRERCFLAGDAAHIHAPAGGQGMNLAIGDAYNLGWKLALVLRGEVAPALLDSYEAERREVARAIINGVDRGFELEATTNPLVEAFRIYLLPHLINLSGRLGLMRGIIYRLFSQTWIEYRQSAIVATGSSHKAVRAGDRAPDGMLQRIESGDHRLFELLRGVDHHLLLFEGQQAYNAITQIEQSLRELLRGFKVTAQFHRISYDQVDLQRRYGATTPCFFLIRPDGHVAYSGDAGDLDHFRAYLAGLYVRATYR